MFPPWNIRTGEVKIFIFCKYDKLGEDALSFALLFQKSATVFICYSLIFNEVCTLIYDLEKILHFTGIVKKMKNFI